LVRSPNRLNMTIPLTTVALPALSLVAAALSGCASPTRNTSTQVSLTALQVVSKATDEQIKSTLGKLKMLEGRWAVTADNGMKGETVFTVSSVGSVVREVMFPDTDHEMTNMYHMDGPCCIATHYCGGNTQPRMMACAPQGNSLNFVLERSSNVSDANVPFMGGLGFTFISPDHIEQRWTNVSATQSSPYFTFTLKRIAAQ
jgi:hypothetical protein